MGSRSDNNLPAAADISLSFVLSARPSRAAAFRSAVTSLLHAGYAFGRDLPGHIVYSFDLAGEHYVETLHVPADTSSSFDQAHARLSALAPFYNHSIGMSFAHGTAQVCARVYDEPDALVFSLDIAAQTWGRLVSRRAPQAGVTELINAGRILFTLLPVELLLIGPSALLEGLPLRPSERRLRTVPIAMLARDVYPSPAVDIRPPLYQEHLSRGVLVVYSWDIAQAVAPAAQPARTFARTSRG